MKKKSSDPNLPLVLTLLSINNCFFKTDGRFFQILWSSHYIWTLQELFRVTNTWNGNDLEGMTMPDPCCFSINNPEDIWGQSWNLWLFQFFLIKKDFLKVILKVSWIDHQLCRSILQQKWERKKCIIVAVQWPKKVETFFSKKSCRSSSQTFESSRWSERKTCLDSNFYH